MILIYKASIPGSKLFTRVYEVKSEMSLFKFHVFIQNNLGFAPDQMILFKAYSAEEKLRHRYGLFDLGGGSMDTVTVGQTLERKETQLRYVYNIEDGTYLRLDYVGEGEFSTKNSYPRMTSSKGMDPDQFSKTYSDPDEMTPDIDALAPEDVEVYDGDADGESSGPSSND
jgi:hypothetical protein